jgi:hypothetical protein
MVIALRFHGHGFVSRLLGCCRVSAAIALVTATRGGDAPCLRPPSFPRVIADAVAIEIAAGAPSMLPPNPRRRGCASAKTILTIWPAEPRREAASRIASTQMPPSPAIRTIPIGDRASLRPSTRGLMAHFFHQDAVRTKPGFAALTLACSRSAPATPQGHRHDRADGARQAPFWSFSFTADRPNMLWVADITYIRRGPASCIWRSCSMHSAVVSGRWRSPCTRVVLDALNMALAAAARAA